MYRRPSPRDCVVWALVIGGHVLVLMLFASAGRLQPPRLASAIDEARALLLVMVPAMPSEEPTPDPPEERRPVRPVPELPAADTAITLPRESIPPAPAAPAIDWLSEGERAAREAAEKSTRPGPRAFGEHPTSPYRRCKAPKSSFEWDPEPDKAGFAGGLPFVRLGERCILVLGFFGCAIGDLPKPNSHLFDDMHDPERVTGSVPGPDDCLP
jgi:hypothetical protein